MGAKFNGVVGIGRATDASTLAAPSHYLQCGTAIIDDTPIIYDRDSIASPQVEYSIGGGHKHTFSIDGIEVPIGHLGYLLWLALGSDTWDTDHHDIVPASTTEYLCLQLDRGIQLGSQADDQAQILLGAKIGSMRLEIPKNGFAKCSISGLACDLDTEDGTLTQSIPTGANNAPVSWQSMKDGYFKLGYPTSPASDTAITRFALDISRELNDEDTDLGSDQPVGIYEGKLVITYEVDKPFRGASAKTAYEAWRAQTQVGLDVDLTCGSYSAVLTAAYGHITGGFAREIGASNETIMGRLQVKTHRNNTSSPALAAVVIDATSGAYT